MNLITRDPFFGNFLDDLFESKHQNITIRSDIYEKDGNYVIEADIPGFKKSDVKVDYDNGYVTITALNETENKEEDVNYIKKERYYGEIKRSYYVGDIDEKDIKAKFENGTLKLEFPKENPKKASKLIPIE